VPVEIGIVDDLVLGLTASWFANTIWGALFSLAILAFVEVRGESKVAGGIE
jgi:hypothetical protein